MFKKIYSNSNRYISYKFDLYSFLLKFKSIKGICNETMDGAVEVNNNSLNYFRSFVSLCCSYI